MQRQQTKFWPVELLERGVCVVFLFSFSGEWVLYKYIYTDFVDCFLFCCVCVFFIFIFFGR